METGQNQICLTTFSVYPSIQNFIKI